MCVCLSTKSYVSGSKEVHSLCNLMGKQDEVIHLQSPVWWIILTLGLCRERGGGTERSGEGWRGEGGDGKKKSTERRSKRQVDYIFPTPVAGL